MTWEAIITAATSPHDAIPTVTTTVAAVGSGLVATVVAMTAAELTPIIVALLTGGAATQLIQLIAAKRKGDAEVVQLLYSTWKDEQARMNREMRHLRAIVVALSSEVERLGGDAIAIRMAHAEEIVDSRPQPEE